MNDLHDDLHEMFGRREGDVRSPASAPRQLVVRTRRRQWLSAGGGVVVALAVVLVSIAGLRSLSQPDASKLGDVGPITTRTVNGITVAYPERWFAVDPVAIGIEPNDSPRTLPALVLALTRDDPHIDGVLGCPLLANFAGQVLMTVQETPLALSGEDATPWPVPLLAVDLGGGETGGCYEGWTFMRASWTAAGRSFEARLGFAADATDADRAAVLDAFGSMTFAPGSVSAQDEVQLATGTTEAGAAWSLTAARTGDLCWNLLVDTDSEGSGTGTCTDGRAMDAPSLTSTNAGSDTVFGGIVPSDAVIVEIDVFEGAPNGIYNASLFPAPSDGWGDVRFMVFAAPTPSGTGTVRFQDENGSELYPAQKISWDTDGGAPNEGPTSRELPWRSPGGRITASDRLAGIDWKVEVLYYLDGVRLTIGDAPDDLGVLRIDKPIVRPLGADGASALVLVLTDTSVDTVSIESGPMWDGRWMPASTGAGGEARLWVIEVLGTGTGNLLLNGQISGTVRWP